MPPMPPPATSSRPRRSGCRRRAPALLPNVGLTGRTDANKYSTNEPDISNTYSVYGGGVNLSVPLYRPQNWEALEQAKISVMQADLTLQQSAQDLTLRVATAYFNVLAARRSADRPGRREARHARTAAAGQARVRGRHQDHHRHQRSAGALRPDRGAGAGGARHAARASQRTADHHRPRSRHAGAVA